MKKHLTNERLVGGWPALLLVACLVWTACPARGATNLLVNGNMSSEAGWTEWFNGPGIWSGTWAEGGAIPPVGEQTMLTNGIWDGTAVYKLGFGGGVDTNEPVHIYQEFGAAPGAAYELACDAGVQDWWHLWCQTELIFFDSVSNVLATSIVVVSTNLHDDFNGVEDLYDIGTAMYRVTNSAVAPVGTTKVRAQLSAIHGTQPPSGGGGTTGGNAFFDNAVLTSTIIPPVIAELSPEDGALLSTNNTLSFKATSAGGITNVVVLVNGVDVTGELVISGPSTNRSVAYPNLQSNELYEANISITDSSGITSSQAVTFDTLNPVVLWEAEDYNYGGGAYLNDPTPTTTPSPGVSYFGVTGFEGIDFHDYSANGPQAYRASDTMATGVAASEYVRQKFVTAGALDHHVGYFDGPTFGAVNDGIDNYDGGEWANYTRDFPPGAYNLYGRLSVGHDWARFLVSQVTSDPTLGNQTTTPLGVFEFTPQGWGNYVYVPLTDTLGNPVVFSPTGTTTLRITAASGGDMNFFLAVPADTNRVTITDVYPDGRMLLQGTNTLTFTVSSPNAIAQSNVVLTLNGVDVSGSLSFSGSATSWDVAAPLALGVTNYAAVIEASDDAGNSHSATVYFDTFDAGSFLVEAEDYDFNSGQFIDDPRITSVNAADSYFDHPSAGLRIETLGVDAYLGDNVGDLITNLNTGTFRYRALGDIRTDVNTDTPRLDLVDAQSTNAFAFSYNVSYMRSNTWLNYTRTYPAGEFNVYARLASSLDAYSLPLQEVNGSTTVLGHFEGAGRGFNFYDWIPLVETNGALAKVTLGGVSTLRFMTPEGEVNPNNFLFVPAVTLPADLEWSYAAGVLTLTWDDPAFHLQSQTNAPGAGLTSDWADHPGGGSSPVNVTVDPSQGSVFFRLSDE